MHGVCHDSNYTAKDPLIMEVVKKRFLQSLAVAKVHQIPRIIFHTTYNRYEDVNPQAKERWLQRAEDFWRNLMPSVPAGTTVYIENMEETQPEIFLELLQRLAPLGIACCFDVGHAYCHSKVPLSRWLELLLPHIRHVHLHDNDSTFDQHRPLGRGNLPLVEVLSQMIPALPEDTPFVFECDLLETLQWLSDHRFAAPYSG